MHKLLCPTKAKFHGRWSRWFGIESLAQLIPTHRDQQATKMTH